MKRKPAKGELRRNKLHIPHPVRRLRRTGLVRSVVPPLPTRIASLDSRGSPVPFANPLKTTKKGAAAPLPWIFPVVWFVLKSFLDLQNAIQMRLCQTGVVVEILCGKVGRTEASAPTSLLILETLRIPYVKYSTGANKTTRTAYRALGKPDWTAARRAFGRWKRNDSMHNETTSFSGASALFRSPASLFCILFSDKPEKSMSAKRYRAILAQNKNRRTACPAEFLSFV